MLNALPSLARLGGFRTKNYIYICIRGIIELSDVVNGLGALICSSKKRLEVMGECMKATAVNTHGYEYTI